LTRPWGGYVTERFRLILRENPKLYTAPGVKGGSRWCDQYCRPPFAKTREGWGTLCVVVLAKGQGHPAKSENLDVWAIRRSLIN
jgi:hypothetical protein